MLLLQVGRAVPTTPWELVLTSSRETKFVLAILVVFPIAPWYLILLKRWQFRRIRRQADPVHTQNHRGIEKPTRFATPNLVSRLDVSTSSQGVVGTARPTCSSSTLSAS